MKTRSRGDAITYRTAENAAVTAAPIDRAKAGETLDTLFQGDLKFIQSRMGYRFSLDSVLLAYFVTIRNQDKVADLGSGSGIISVMLAYLHRSVAVTGVEFQVAMADRARRNVRLNGFDKRIEIAQGDVRAIEKIAAPESFEVVVCNPPYRRPSSGRVNPDEEKSISRHEIKGTLHDFLRAGAYLLPIKGRMALVYLAEGLTALLHAMRGVSIEPKRLRMVHSDTHSEASLVLVEGVKGARNGSIILPPLVVYEQGRKYTGEVAAMLTGRLGAA